MVGDGRRDGGERHDIDKVRMSCSIETNVRVGESDSDGKRPTAEVQILSDC